VIRELAVLGVEESLKIKIENIRKY